VARQQGQARKAASCRLGGALPTVIGRRELPGRAAAALASGDVIEVERTVNAPGNASLGNYIISAGLPLARQLD
jgi:hypothetical protein